MQKIKKIWHNITIMSRTQQLTLVGIIAIAIIAVAMVSRSETATVAPSASARTVVLKSVAVLSENSSPLDVSGEVSSINEARIRTEASGLIRVYRKLGDSISAGTVIAEIENSAERAQVLQAEGAYENALVILSRAKNGAREEIKDISLISTSQAARSLSDARIAAQNTINSSYATMDDALRTKTDSVYSNPTNRSIKLIVNSSDSRVATTLESERAQFEAMLQARYRINEALTVESNLVEELVKVEAEVIKIRNYLDDLIYVLNKGIPDSSVSQTQIELYKANASAARSLVIGQLSQISGAKESLNARIAAFSISEKQLSQTAQGDTNDIMQAEAAVKQALGALRGAQSRLEKTIVRSPLSGTINRLSVDTGDYVAPFTEAAVVSNNGSVEIIINLSEDDVATIKVGNTATIDSVAKAVITRIAPALDPVTKKIEVRLAVTDNNSTITNGKSVRVALDRDKSATIVSNKVSIPLSAVKITPDGAVVFTLSASSTLVANPVTLGTLYGDSVEIKDGVRADSMIVTDARGLQDGMTVVAK